MLSAEQIREWSRDFLTPRNQFVTHLKVGSDAHIQIFIDGDRAVTLQDCVQLSRHIESLLDRDRLDFRLDVSTPGATEPLLLPRQYPKHRGRILAVETQDGSSVTGTLEACSEEGITLHYSVREPKPLGKGKHTVHKTAVLPYPLITKAIVQLPFQ